MNGQIRRKEMKSYAQISISLILLILLSSLLTPFAARAADTDKSVLITEWEIAWVEERSDTDEDRRSSNLNPADIENWIHVDARVEIPSRPAGISEAWIKIKLPQIPYTQSAMFFDDLYAQNFEAYIEDRLVYAFARDHLFWGNRLLIPVSQSDSGSMMYLYVSNNSNIHPVLGIVGPATIGEYKQFLAAYVQIDLFVLMIGASLLLLGILCMSCSLFLDKKRRPIGLSLGGVNLFSGLLFITYSPFMFSLFNRYSEIILILFEISLLMVIPTFLYFFELIFGPGKYEIIKRLRVFQTCYTAGCLLFLAVNIAVDYRFNEWYFIATVNIFGVLMLVELMLVSIIAILRAMKKDPSAILFSVGIGFLVAMIAIDMLFSYTSEFYNFVFWRWGISGFLIAQFVLLGRKLAGDHREIINYSKKLELFNQQMQRSEKMQIISELAASIAHEVRNPLQVTRGFLQLFSSKSTGNERGQMQLAINELDRASDIISDFLTFSKPELEEMKVLNIQDELEQIKGIIVPLTHINGGTLIIEPAQGIQIYGNSSRFKQALINIIKNSIEAFTEDGEIVISTWVDHNEVVICVKDNGVGMSPLEIARLGEPYFSTKSKGTGLGMMVTFRIIELMRGQLSFTSAQGEGTEAILRFPIYTKQEGSSE
jgi:two-component system sporulation sensor kinase B